MKSHDRHFERATKPPSHRSSLPQTPYPQYIAKPHGRAVLAPLGYFLHGPPFPLTPHYFALGGQFAPSQPYQTDVAESCPAYLDHKNLPLT